MADGTVRIDVDVNDSEGHSKIQDLERGFGGVGKASSKAVGSIKNMAASLGLVKIASAGVNLLRNSVSGAIDRVDTLNNSSRAFENMGFAASETETMMDNLVDSITGLPTPLEDAVGGVQLLAASTNDLELSQGVYSAMNNAILGFGGSTEQVNGAMTQLSQAFSQGKIDGQTWNSMMNNQMGPALNALADNMGITTDQLQQGLSDGTISMDEFAAGMIDLNKNGSDSMASLEQIAADSTAGIGTSIQNMKTAVTRGMADMIETINKGLEDAGLPTISEMIAIVGEKIESALGVVGQIIPPIIAMFAEWIPYIVQVVQAVSSFVQEWWPLIAGIAAGVAAFQFLTTVIPLVVAAFKGFSILMTLVKTVGLVQAAFTLLAPAILSVSWPLVAIAAVIGIVVAAGIYLYRNWEQVGAYASVIWEGIKTVVTTVATAIWNVITTIFTTVLTVVSTVFQAIYSVISAIITAVFTVIQVYLNLLLSFWAMVFNVIRTVASTVFNAIRSIITLTMNIIRSIISAVLNGIKVTFITILNGIRNGVTASFNAIRSIITSVLNIVRSIVSSVLSGIRATFSSIFNSLRGIVSSAFNSVVNAVKSGMNKAWNTVKNFTKKFFTAGRNIVTSIADGIKSAVGAVTNAISGVVSKVRDFLPFSPAKVGPLDDIHRLNFDGPITDSIYDGLPNVQKAMNDLLQMPDVATLQPSVSKSIYSKQVVEHSDHRSRNESDDHIARKLLDALDNFGVYLDGDELVGSTFTKYDEKGGRNAQLTERWSTS